MITKGNSLYQVLLVVSDERGEAIPGAFPTIVDPTYMSGLGLTYPHLLLLVKMQNLIEKQFGMVQS